MAGRQCACDPSALRYEHIQEAIGDIFAVVAELPPPAPARDSASAAAALVRALAGGLCEAGGGARRACEQFARGGVPPLLAALAALAGAEEPGGSWQEIARLGGERVAALFALSDGGHALGCPACDPGVAERFKDATCRLAASLCRARAELCERAAAAGPAPL